MHWRWSALPAVNALLAFGLGRRLLHQVFRAAAVLVVVLGVLTLMRGLALLGLVPHFGIW